MSFSCPCFNGRSRIQLPSGDLRYPPPRFALHVEPKNHSPRASISPRYRLTRSTSANRDHSLSAHLLSEKETPLLLEETEVVEEEEETNDTNDAASRTSSTVSLPSTRITSVASTFTGGSRFSRISDDGAEPPPYTPPMRRMCRSNDELEESRSAGDLYRDIQQRITDAGDRSRR